MPLSTTAIHYPVSLIIISKVRQEADTDRRKYFASCYYAKHSLHTTAGDLSAHLSWTLNHFPGILWNNFLYVLICASECILLSSLQPADILIEFQGGPGYVLPLKAKITSQSMNSAPPALLVGCFAQAERFVSVWHYSLFFQLVLQRKETIGTRGDLMNVPIY